MPRKRSPPRRVPNKLVMNPQQQSQFLRQQSAQMERMYQQKLQARRAQLLRGAMQLTVVFVLTLYVYQLYGIVIAFFTALSGLLIGGMEFLHRVLLWLSRVSQQASYNEALRRADIMKEPKREKETVSGENESLSYGCSSMQGWRRSMEDDHTLQLLEDGGFFGVYDGHSGGGTAQFCGEHLFRFVSETKAFEAGEITQALYDGFIAIDKHLYALPKHERSGCAAVVLFIKGDDIYCANAGDSRCVMCRNGAVDALSTDHKPFSPAEQTRIERAGGFVLNRRVNGILALSRGIGDFGFKTNVQVPWDLQAVTSAPEVRVTRLNRDKDEFAVIACDGIWDVMKSEEVVEFVRPRIQNRMPLGVICEELMDACMSPQPFGIGCDNMSVIIVQFKRRPQEQNASSTLHPLPHLSTAPLSHSSSGNFTLSPSAGARIEATGNGDGTGKEAAPIPTRSDESSSPPPLSTPPPLVSAGGLQNTASQPVFWTLAKSSKSIEDGAIHSSKVEESKAKRVNGSGSTASDADEVGGSSRTAHITAQYSASRGENNASSCDLFPTEGQGKS